MKTIRILYIALTFIVSLSSAAQSIPSNAKEILTSKDWKIESFATKTDVYKITFTETKTLVYLNDELIAEREYYFSTTLNDCSENGFNENNLGNSSGGKYLISENSCLELISVSTEELKFKNVYGGNTNTITTAHPF